MTTELTGTPAWTRIHALWPQFLTLKTSTAPPSDGMPRASSDPSHRAVLNMNILVLEIEIEDFVNRHCHGARMRGQEVYNIEDLLSIDFPENQPPNVQQSWWTNGADFLEEIESLLGHKPRPWTQHKLDLLAEYPDRFQLTQAQTLIALAALGQPMNKQTLSMRVKNGIHTTDQNGHLNLAEVLATPTRKYQHAEVL